MTLTPVEMLARLVGFPTVSADSNLDLIGFVRAHLAAQGVACRVVPNADGTKANLWASIGPDVPGGVILSGHTDVVPVVGQPWTSDPFQLTRRGDAVFGRGTADMKGFLAIALALVPDMVAAGLKRPLHLALSYDEEVGCLGAPAMIADMARSVRAEAVVVGEPTMMRVVTSHKGVMGLRTHVRGHEIHSSLVHRGVSAIHVAARLIGWLEAETARQAARAAGAPLYDPPYTTLHCGVIEGGTAANITAKDCRFSTDIRMLPGESGADYLAAYRAVCAAETAAMQAVVPGTGIDVAIRSDTPPCRREDAGAAEALARALTGDNGTHVVAFGTEAGLFQGAGYSTVICGPGDIAVAHAADEHISLAQMAAGEAFQRRLIARLAA